MSETASGPAAVVTLYSRPGCHLCDEARALLLALREGGRHFELREVNIESDDALHAAMVERIPVVEIDGEQVSELWLDEAAFMSRLDTVRAMSLERSTDVER